jgi:hypothetical protein
MAGLSTGWAYLEDIELYGPPNKALAQILLGPGMYAIVAGYTAKVVSNYVTRQSGERYKDPKRQYRAGGHPPGATLQSLEASVEIGGFRNDRWTGQISVGVVYAGAGEYGRKKYAPYAGTANLRQALHGVLPNSP